MSDEEDVDDEDDAEEEEEEERSEERFMGEKLAELPLTIRRLPFDVLGVVERRPGDEEPDEDGDEEPDDDDGDEMFGLLTDDVLVAAADLREIV